MPVDKNSPRDPHLAQHASQPAPRGEPHKTAGQPAEVPGARRGKKQVRFSEVDAVTTYRPGETFAGHDLPVTRAAKPAAPAEARGGARPACAVLTEQDGSRSILWPSGQRYHGSYDNANVPHGEGTVRLADGHEHVSTWFHGTCTAVAGDAARARGVEHYLSPAVKRTATPQARSNRTASSTPSEGGASKARNLLGKLRNLGKKDAP